MNVCVEENKRNETQNKQINWYIRSSVDIDIIYFWWHKINKIITMEKR